LVTVTVIGCVQADVLMSPAPSGLTVALESPQRDRTFLTYLGVNARWAGDDPGRRARV
jgi:hypothetical protein